MESEKNTAIRNDSRIVYGNEGNRKKKLLPFLNPDKKWTKWNDSCHETTFVIHLIFFSSVLAFFFLFHSGEMIVRKWKLTAERKN